MKEEENRKEIILHGYGQWKVLQSFNLNEEWFLKLSFLTLSLDYIQVQGITFNFYGSQDGYTIANSLLYKLPPGSGINAYLDVVWLWRVS